MKYVLDIAHIVSCLSIIFYCRYLSPCDDNTFILQRSTQWTFSNATNCRWSRPRPQKTIFPTTYQTTLAYEIISDEEKRKIYDQHGLEGVEQEGGPGGPGGGEDLFSMFFGGGGRGRQAGPRKGPSLQHPLKVSLNDLYNGKTVKLAINRKVIVGESSECGPCRGQGVVMEMRQIGPGMITQMQRACGDCAGRGYKAKTKNERKVIEVHVEKGAANNQKITFRGMADEVPGRETGDVNFVIQEKEHDFFKRKGADLLIMQDISLNQALTGFSVSLV
jgi:DnaJ family protein A protein 2